MVKIARTCVPLPAAQRQPGLALSSISSSFSPLEVSEVPQGSIDTCGAKRMILSSACTPKLRLVMVSIDHTTLGPTAAFFKESIRRDAMTGTKTEFVLWRKEVNISCSKFALRQDKKKPTFRA